MLLLSVHQTYVNILITKEVNKKANGFLFIVQKYVSQIKSVVRKLILIEWCHSKLIFFSYFHIHLVLLRNKLRLSLIAIFFSATCFLDARC